MSLQGTGVATRRGPARLTSTMSRRTRPPNPLQLSYLPPPPSVSRTHSLSRHHVPHTLPRSAHAPPGAGLTPAYRSEGRSSGQPEDHAYHDTGCYVHPHCLTCPLAVCIEDEPPLYRTPRRRAIIHNARALLGRPAAATQLMALHSLSRRSAQRWLATVRSLDNPPSTIGRA